MYPNSIHSIYTLAPKYLERDYFKAKVYTIRVHGPLGEKSSALWRSCEALRFLPDLADAGLASGRSLGRCPYC